MEKQEMNTLVECIEILKKNDFTNNFNIKNGFLTLENPQKKYRPKDVKIDSFYRFEGESDPSDNSILYAITTNDGNKGIVIDAYGIYADNEISGFISQVEDISKQKVGMDK